MQDFKRIAALVEKHCHWSWWISDFQVSYFEIYMDKIRDLLDSK